LDREATELAVLLVSMMAVAVLVGLVAQVVQRPQELEILVGLVVLMVAHPVLELQQNEMVQLAQSELFGPVLPVASHQQIRGISNA
jgi:hypothetical protein